MTPDDNASTPSDRSESAVRTVQLPTDESTSMAVVLAIADVLGRDPLELEPLSAQLDPEALDTLVAEAAGDHTDLSISFSFAGCAVVVTPTQVRIRGEFDPAGSD